MVSQHNLSGGNSNSTAGRCAGSPQQTVLFLSLLSSNVPAYRPRFALQLRGCCYCIADWIFWATQTAVIRPCFPSTGSACQPCIDTHCHLLCHHWWMASRCLTHALLTRTARNIPLPSRGPIMTQVPPSPHLLCACQCCRQAHQASATAQLQHLLTPEGLRVRQQLPAHTQHRNMYKHLICETQSTQGPALCVSCRPCQAQADAEINKTRASVPSSALKNQPTRS